MLLDGINVEEYNFSVVERPEVPSPEEDVEHVYIKGRNGSLTKKHGYKDIPYSIQLNYLEMDEPFKRAFRHFKIILHKAKQLSFTDDLGVYYKIKSVSVSGAENEIKEYGMFTLDFVLDPFQYEETNSQTITTRTILTNPGYTSAPIITAHINGTGKIYVNKQVVTLKDVNGTITMDSDMLNAYRIDDEYITNLNNHMIGDFLMLENGDNVIDFDGDISKLIINSRWRWL